MQILRFIVFLCLNTACLAAMHDSHCSSSEWFVYKNFCLLISKNQYTWKDAEMFCKNKSATMVKIEDDKKYKFIQNYFNTSVFEYVWVNRKY